MKNDKIANKDTVFIIGSGKSLNKIDMSKLAGQNTISMNRQYIAYDDWGFTPTYYLIIDSKLIKTIHKDIESIIKERDIKKLFIMKHLGNPYKMSGWVDKMRSENGEKIVRISDCGSGSLLKTTKDTSHELDGKRVSFCGNAGACAVDVARSLGYKRVVLLGVDAKYVSRSASVASNEDLSHFRPDYFDIKTFKEGVNQGKDTYHAGTHYWKLFSEQQKSIPDFEIISSSPDSPINEFLEYVEFDELFVDK